MGIPLRRTLAARCLLSVPLALILLGPSLLPAQARAARDDYNYAAGLHDRGLHDRAVKAFEAYLAKWPRDGRRPKAEFYLGESLATLEQEAKALPHFISSADRGEHPLRNEARLRAGELLHRAGDDKKALKYLNALLSADPPEDLAAPGLYLKAEASSADGRLDDARSAYEALLDRYGSCSYAPFAANALGFMSFREKAYDAALDRFRRSLRSDTEGEAAVEALTMMGQCLIAKGKPGDALTAFRRAEKGNGTGFADQIILGRLQAHLDLGQEDEALASYGQFRQRFPKDGRGHQALIRAAANLHGKGEDKRGLRIIQAVEGAQGREARDHAYWSGVLLTATGQVDDAIARLRQALSNEPNPKRKFSLADALSQKGEFEEAARLFVEVRKETKDQAVQAEAIFAEAFARNRLEQYGNAVRLLTRLAGRDLPSELAQDVRFALAENQFTLKRYEDAEKSYSQLLRDEGISDDRRASCLYKIGWCHHLSKRNDQAIARLEALVRRYGDSSLVPEARYLIGKCHEAEGRHGLARKAFAALSGERSELGAKALLGAAATARRTGDEKAAEQAWRAVIRTTEDVNLKAEALADLASLLSEKKDWEGADALYAQLLRDHANHPRAAEARLGQAWSLRSQGEHKSAARAAARLARATEDAHLRGEALYLQALEEHAQGRAVVALKVLDEFDASGARHVRAREARFLRGLCEARRGRHDEAAQVFEAVADAGSGPDQASALYEWGFCLEALKKTDERDRVFARLLKNHPESRFVPDVLFRLGEAAYAAERWDAAVAHYDALARHDSAGDLRDKALYKSGWCHKRKGQAAEAADRFAAVAEIKKSPLAAESCYLAGEQHHAAGAPKSAADAFSQMTRRHGDHSLASEARARRVLCLAALESWDGVIRESPSALDALEDEGPLVLEVSSAFGDAFFVKRAWDRARAAYGLVTTSEGPLAARAQYRIGLTHAKEKNPEKAIDALLKVTILYGHAEWVAKATLLSADLLVAQGQKEKGRRLYQDLVKSHAAFPEAATAKERLATLDKNEESRK